MKKTGARHIPYKRPTITQESIAFAKGEIGKTMLEQFQRDATIFVIQSAFGPITISPDADFIRIKHPELMFEVMAFIASLDSDDEHSDEEMEFSTAMLEKYSDELFPLIILAKAHLYRKEMADYERVALRAFARFKGNVGADVIYRQMLLKTKSEDDSDYDTQDFGQYPDIHDAYPAETSFTPDEMVAYYSYRVQHCHTENKKEELHNAIDIIRQIDPMVGTKIRIEIWKRDHPWQHKGVVAAFFLLITAILGGIGWAVFALIKWIF